MKLRSHTKVRRRPRAQLYDTTNRQRRTHYEFSTRTYVVNTNKRDANEAMWAHATPNAHMRHARATTQGPRADTAPTLTKYDAHACSPAHARHTLPRGRWSSRVPSAGTHEPLRGARGSDARAAERAGGRNLAARAGLAVRMSSPRPAVKPGPIRGQAGLRTRECTPTAGQPRTQGARGAHSRRAVWRPRCSRLAPAGAREVSGAGRTLSARSEAARPPEDRSEAMAFAPDEHLRGTAENHSIRARGAQRAGQCSSVPMCPASAPAMQLRQLTRL